MPAIIIKELLGSDSISGLAEKINFNFDQIVLSGGGPRGFVGASGPSGPAGPQGQRGNFWFSGATAFGVTLDYDNNSLEPGDHHLNLDGIVYKFFETSTGATGWTGPVLTLVGVTGPTGGTGGSNEFSLYPGITSNTIDVNAFGPGIGGPISAPSGNQDFVVPTYPTLSNFFIGNRTWVYNKLDGFGNDASGLAADQGNIPKFTIIQNEVNYEGLNGLSIGAQGLTSLFGATLPAIGSTGDEVSAHDFYNFGFYRTSGLPEYHKFQISSHRSSLEITAGGNSGVKRDANIEINSKNLYIANYDQKRIITSAGDLMSAIANMHQNHITINALPDSLDLGGVPGGTAGFVSLQSIAGSISNAGIDHNFGEVIIGPTFSTFSGYSAFALGDPSALKIVRNISTYASNPDSSIKFYSADTAADENDHIGKIIAAQGSLGKSLQISSSRISLNHGFGNNKEDNVAKMPVHITQEYGNGATSHWNNSYLDPYVTRWVFGVDSPESGGPSRTQNQGKGLGLGYSISDLIGIRELVLQTYYTGETGSADIFGTNEMETRNPSLSLLPGNEKDNGNLALGFINRHANLPAPLRATSKLSVSGSIKVGQDSWHIINNLAPTAGILSEGNIIQGSILDGVTISSSDIDTIIGTTEGIYSKGRIQATNFVATAGARRPMAYSLGDFFTGMRAPNSAGEGYLTVKKDGVDDSELVAVFSALGDSGTETDKYAFSIHHRFATNARYITGEDLIDFNYQVITPPPGEPNDYVIVEVPTDYSTIVFMGDGTYDTGLGYNGSWASYFVNQGITNLTSPYNKNIRVHLEKGHYDGQELEIVSGGWGLSSSFTTFALYNDVKYDFSSPKDPRMHLGREYNTGPGITNLLERRYSPMWTNGPGTNDEGMPYPFPHGATTIPGQQYLSRNSTILSNWSASGQFSIYGYNSIQLKWLRLYQGTQENWRWVEISRSTRANDGWVNVDGVLGNPGYYPSIQN